MHNFLETNSELFLLDPKLFKEYFSNIKKIIPIFEIKDSIYFFVKQKSIIQNEKKIIQKELDEDLLNEKIYLIKNYEIIKQEKNFDQAPIRVIIDFILTEAILNDISDIHFNINSENEYLVKFKKNTILYDYCKLKKNQFESIIFCFKLLSEIDTAKRHLPQSSSFYKFFKGEMVNFRISTHPTILGERFVLRILAKKNVKNYKTMNLDEKTNNIIERVINHPNGLILFTGPTNSGKTTLIHSIISEIAKKNVTVMTLEDPVEYIVPGIIQTNISENGLTFFEGMKSILRQDPDVVFLGEIRDSQTAKIAIQSALTGHKVLATLHAYSNKGAIKRLIDMGISNIMLAECLLALFSQRLLRKINGNKQFQDLCLLIDAMFFEEKYKDYVRENKLEFIEDQLKENALNLMKKGIITKEEIKKVIG